MHSNDKQNENDIKNIICWYVSINDSNSLGLSFIIKIKNYN